ncbi:Transposon Ty3-I Gag-Pol polyprotein [Pelomyxa schiedti]|nr:Transposon Ty3-I Gag-Pol polyprotein [Pelomyxa schiedti]
MLKAGVCQWSNSAYSAPVVMVKKKDGSIRFCVDYRELNKTTVNDQLKMREEDIHKTAINCALGHLEMTRMPFGLTNTGATFQRAMNSIFQGNQWIHILTYIDDIIIFSKSFSEHMEHLEEGIRPDPDKIRAIVDVPAPKSKEDSKEGIGVILSQGKPGERNYRVISYWSRKLKQYEGNYAITELEALAVVCGILRHREYLDHGPWHLYTDHSALVTIQNTTPPNSRIWRWFTTLQSCMPTQIFYRKGRSNSATDALSRAPVEEVKDNEEQEGLENPTIF